LATPLRRLVRILSQDPHGQCWSTFRKQRIAHESGVGQDDLEAVAAVLNVLAFLDNLEE